ncbi:MAG: NlpC/P60 family protein [bacterium]
MTTGAAVVAEARKWLGTPYRHQGTRRGAGTDCLGLVRGVWRAVVGQEPTLIPAYSEDWSEPQREEALLDAAMRWLRPKPISSTDIGDVLVFRMRSNNVAKHLGIVAELQNQPTFLHAYTGHGVVETYLTLPWSRRVVGRFEFPSGEN